MKREEVNLILKQVTLLSQLGLSIIMPTVLCVLACWYLNAKCGVGSWVYIFGFILGIGGSFMTAYKFYIMESKKGKKETKKRVSFNKHL